MKKLGRPIKIPKPERDPSLPKALLPKGKEPTVAEATAICDWYKSNAELCLARFTNEQPTNQPGEIE